LGILRVIVVDTLCEVGIGKKVESLIPKHGGYRKLKSFQLAELIYDVTVRFCDKYIDRKSRTHDQMVQAARSGRQNIAEGSVDSATSKKIEIKLTGIAKGSQEELRLDYEDYLRQRELPQWPPDHPALKRFKALRCSTLGEFRAWVADEVKRGAKNTDRHEQAQTQNVTPAGAFKSPCASVYPSVCVANGALSLLNLCVYLLDRQLKALAAAFEKEGGFTERLYRKRLAARQT
jgi:four helix bundle suffix protein